MTFRNMRFPTNIKSGAVGGPRYDSDVVTVNSGFESRNENWADARCEYAVERGLISEELRVDLIAFFRRCKGRVHSFRFKDWSDYTVLSGEGVLRQLTSTTYQLVKRYTTDDGTDDRDITLPYEVVVRDSSTTLILGVHYSIALLTGIITVIDPNSPPVTPDSWTGKYDVPCRFDTDRLQLVAETVGFFVSQSIPIVEIRYPETE